MTNNNIIPRSDFIKNNGRTSLKIKLNMSGGVLRGNIIDKPQILEPVVPPEPVICLENALDFSCAENSEYLSVI